MPARLQRGGPERGAEAGRIHRELAAGTGALLRQSTYTPRHTAYDLRKIRSKGRIGRVGRPGGAGRLKPGRPPKEPHPLDVHHENLQREMRRTFRALRLAA